MTKLIFLKSMKPLLLSVFIAWRNWEFLRRKSIQREELLPWVILWGLQGVDRSLLYCLSWEGQRKNLELYPCVLGQVWELQLCLRLNFKNNKIIINLFLDNFWYYFLKFCNFLKFYLKNKFLIFLDKIDLLLDEFFY